MGKILPSGGGWGWDNKLHFNTCFCFAYLREKDDKEKAMKQETLPDLLSSDMHRKMMRKKWEAEEEEMRSRGPGPLHYQNLKFDGKV